MKSFIFWAAVLTVLVGLAFIFYDQPLFHPRQEVQMPAGEETTSTAEEPVVRYPVDTPAPPTEPLASAEAGADGDQALPTLSESDETLQQMLHRMLQEQQLLALLHLQNFIQRFVVTVDSLPEKRISARHLPVRPPQGKFLAAGGSISPENAKRYTPYLQLVETLGIEPAVSIYVRYYDLFQEAYRELGYPKGHFNDRFVAVIDHLLDTPEPKEPIGVVQPLIVYKYADPELEERSAGQKLLLRIGSDNRTRARSILRELRGRLTGLGQPN